MFSRCPIIVFIFILGITSTSLAQFDTVINMPPDFPYPRDFPLRSERLSIGSNTQFNLLGGGRVLEFEAGLRDGSSTNVEVNIFDGRAGGFSAYAGSKVNIFGGHAGRFSAHTGSEVNIFGGDADGFSASGEVNIFGGEIGSAGASLGGEVNIFGGTFGGISAGASRDRVVQEQARLAMMGGTVNGLLIADGESQVVIDDGTADDILARAGSTITVSGGTIAHGLLAEPGSRLILAGGVLPSLTSSPRSGGLPLPFDGVRFEEGSDVTILGSDFRVEGTQVKGLTNPGDSILFDPTLTGIFSDGTPFAIGAFEGRFGRGTLKLEEVSRIEGDYNNSGKVEQGDLDFALLNWGERLYSPYDAGWTNDMPSGTIDQEELDKVLLGWGTSVDGLGTAAVPEPNSVVLSLVMLAVLAWEWRRSPRRF